MDASFSAFVGPVLFLAGDFNEIAIFVSREDLGGMVHEEVSEVAAAFGASGTRLVGNDGKIPNERLTVYGVSFHNLCADAVDMVGRVEDGMLSFFFKNSSGEAIYNEELLGLVAMFDVFADM